MLLTRLSIYIIIDREQKKKLIVRATTFLYTRSLHVFIVHEFMHFLVSLALLSAQQQACPIRCEERVLRQVIIINRCIYRCLLNVQ